MKDGLKSLNVNLERRQEDLRYTSSNFQLTEDIEQLNAMWADNWIAQKICVKRSDDMTRNWRTVTSNDFTPEQLEKFAATEIKLDLQRKLNEALMWSSLYGGVGILIVTDAGIETPINETQRIQRLVVLPPEMITEHGNINDDILSENYAKHDYYKIGKSKTLTGGAIVHYSRLIILNAIPFPPFSKQTFGISDLQPVYKAIKHFDSTSANAGELVTESKTDIFKMTGLTDMLRTEQGTAMIADAITFINHIKTSTGVLLCDMQNDYLQKELSFAGVDSLLTAFRNAVAGAADMPVTILFGQSVSGLASGDEDTRNYHHTIKSLQEKRLRPVLNRLDPLICNEALGYFPTDWRFEFDSLEDVSVRSTVETLNLFAQSVSSLIQNAVITDVQAAKELKQLGIFNNISEEDLALMEEEPVDDSRYTQTGEAEEQGGQGEEAESKENQNQVDPEEQSE